MTRKEKLSQRANEATEQLLVEGVCLSNGECEITDRVILQALQQVEREVWERVEKQAREFYVLYPMCVWRDSSKKDMTARIMGSFADWLKEQQKELG